MRRSAAGPGSPSTRSAASSAMQGKARWNGAPLDGHPIDALRSALGRHAGAPADPRIPFTGGASGYFAYEAGRLFERLPAPKPERRRPSRDRPLVPRCRHRLRRDRPPRLPRLHWPARGRPDRAASAGAGARRMAAPHHRQRAAAPPERAARRAARGVGGEHEHGRLRGRGRADAGTTSPTATSFRPT